MSKGKISEEEFKNAKTNLEGKLALSLDSVYNYANWIAKDIILNQPYETPQEYLAKINRITMKDVVRLAKEIFAPDQLNLAMISPFKQTKAEAFLKDIEKGWRS